MFLLFRVEFRYYAIKLRHMFDQNKDEQNMVKARSMVEKGEEELFYNMHYDQMHCK